MQGVVDLRVALSNEQMNVWTKDGVTEITQFRPKRRMMVRQLPALANLVEEKSPILWARRRSLWSFLDYDGRA